LREPRARRGEFVEVRCPDVSAAFEPDVAAAQIIGQNENDVWLFAQSLRSCDTGGVACLGAFLFEQCQHGGGFLRVLSGDAFRFTGISGEVVEERSRVAASFGVRVGEAPRAGTLCDELPQTLAQREPRAGMLDQEFAALR